MENHNPSEVPQSPIIEAAVQLFKNVYVLTAELPATTMFRQIMALRSAAMSLPPAIAEAELRLEVLESMEFFNLAAGYLVELTNHLQAMQAQGAELAARFAPLLAQARELGQLLQQRLDELAASR